MKVKLIDAKNVLEMDSKDLKKYFDHLHKVLDGLSNTTVGRNNLRDVISMLVTILNNTDLISDTHKKNFKTLQDDFTLKGSTETFPVVCADSKYFIRNASASLQ
jgi:hypothetical protein